MNYISHLNAVFDKFNNDKRLNTTHVSLYMALFYYWNLNRFPSEFYINKHEIMQLSKIGSNPTYHRCMTQMTSWKYFKYLPSHNPYKGSRIRMSIFDTTTKQVRTKFETSSEQVVTPNINSNKQIENIDKLSLPKNENEVLIFFKKKKWSLVEGKKFFNHYKSIGWKLGGKIEIIDWHSKAENWMLRAEEIKDKDASSNKNYARNRDYLKTSKIKDYGQPL
ncbi:hypothetical protein [Gelidibacter japonicus]|uniref:hypothetical protein n=1 Tax=Gelidibacter japonicus TaxID=1962232 RepID=UPI003A92720A